MSLSRPTAHKFPRIVGPGIAALALLALNATPALAKKVQLSEPVGQALSCASQTFSQTFASLNDSNYYTLVPGGEFNSANEGWTLLKGASITQTTRPDGTTGGALDMPSGSIAISPPVCVTLAYPTARVWERSSGSGSVSVAVAYANTKTATKPRTVGTVEGQSGEGWTLSEPFEVRPELGGKEEGTREVRFIFIAGNDADSQLYGLYVDPRLSH